jgi:hypothetical protein
MKKINLTAISVISFVLVSVSSAQTTVFSESFPYPSGSSLATAGWTALQGPNATDVSNTANNNHQISVSASDGYIFSLAVGNEFLVYTEKGPFGSTSPDYTFSDLREVTLGMFNASTGENMRIALRAGSSWYVSDQVLNMSAGTSSISAKEFHTLDITTATWSSLDVVPGTGFTLGSSVTISGTESITAVGVFNTVHNRYRLTNYEVTAVPEPAAVAFLLAAAAFTVVMVRRRRA